jgi:hypothetical protein
MQLINQLANNLKSKIGKCFESYFRPNGRKSARITELINRWKEPGHANNKIRHSGALPEIDMTWIVIVSLGLLTSLRFCRAKWTNLPCGSSAQWLWFCCFNPPDDGELQEKICVNFVQNWHKTKPVNIFILSGARLLIIYILHNNICLMCFLCLLCLLVYYIYYVYWYYLILTRSYMRKLYFKVLIISVLCLFVESCKSKSNTTKRIN